VIPPQRHLRNPEVFFRCRRTGCQLTRPRKFDPKYAAAIQVALDNDSSAAPLDGSLGNGKTKADAAASGARSRFVDTEKRLEDFLVILGRNSMTAIAYRNVDPARTCLLYKTYAADEH
jgi:hypothetical protein